MHVWKVLATFAAIWAVIAAAACAQETLMPRDKHPWGKLPPGSWKRMRLTVETFDERGVATTTVQLVRTTLKSADARSCSLQTEQSSEGAGRSFDPRIQERVVGYSGENGVQKLESVKSTGQREVVLGGRRIPCQVRQAVLNGDGTSRTELTVFYSPDIPPFALRREWSIVATPGTEPTSVVEEVVAMGMPFEAIGQRFSAAFVQTKHNLPQLSRETMEVWSDEVPGGVIAQWSKELDIDGRLLRRSTLELLEYHVPKVAAPIPVRPRVFDRKRARRADEKMSASGRR